MKKLLTLTVQALGLALGAHAAHAAWPQAPIRIVIPYAAGGSADTVLRQLSPLLQARLGQPIVIDNKPGAGGNIGALEVAKSKPDGHTLLLGATNNYVINQYVYPGMGFDPLKAFAPITRVLDVPSLLFTNAAVPARTFAEFAAYAQANPGRLNYGSPGTGTSNHLSGYALSRAMQADMVHVAYKGAPPAIFGLVANDIQLFIGSYSAMRAQLDGGKVKALAVVAPQRLAVAPQTPTVVEAGVPPVVLNNWWGLAAPRDTPPEVIRRLADEFGQALAQPEVKAFFESQGLTPGGTSPDEFARQWEAEARQWREIVRQSGARAE